MYKGLYNFVVKQGGEVMAVPGDLAALFRHQTAGG